MYQYGTASLPAAFPNAAYTENIMNADSATRTEKIIIHRR